MTIRTGIQLAYPFSEKRLTKWRLPYLVQPKLDGERCRAIVASVTSNHTSPIKRVLLLSSSEEIISSIPHINRSMQILPEGEYDGELYIHNRQQNYTHSIISREVNPHPNFEEVQYHIFDKIDNRIQADRITDLNLILRNPPTSIHLVPTTVCFTHSELLSKYDQFIAEGYEGFIVREISSLYVRKRSTEMMKFKPKQTDTYICIKPTEAISEDGKPLGMIGAFECMDDMGTIFKVGAGKLTHSERKEMWEDFIKLYPGEYPKRSKLEVEYQTKSGARGVPLFSRAIRILLPSES